MLLTAELSLAFGQGITVIVFERLPLDRLLSTVVKSSSLMKVEKD